MPDWSWLNEEYIILKKHYEWRYLNFVDRLEMKVVKLVETEPLLLAAMLTIGIMLKSLYLIDLDDTLIFSNDFCI